MACFAMNLEILKLDNNEVSIKVAKYAGEDKVDLIENEEYGYCSLIKATNMVLDKLRIENITKAKITDKQRIEHNLVNPVSLREAIINFIVHNDFTTEYPPLFEIFSNRITMTSYGGLIHNQSIEEFFNGGSMPRNRELMRVFKDVGLVEQLGSGMARILKFYDRSIFEISDHLIKVNFPFKSIPKSIPIELNKTQSYILEIIQLNGQISQGTIAEQLGLSKIAVKKSMKAMVDAGIIKHIGSSRKGQWIILY